MPKHPSAIIGAAGEHFVAARLAAMGYVVALTRGGSPAADLLVTTQKGTASASVQVKTSTWAGRWQKKDPAKNHWEWPISKKAADRHGSKFLYALVDLQDWPDKTQPPQVFIVPSTLVAAWIQKTIDQKWSMNLFWIYDKDKADYLERWDRVVEVLGPPEG